MSLLLIKQLQISVQPERVDIVLRVPGWRGGVRNVSLPVAAPVASQPAWRGAVDSLEHWLAAQPRARTRASLVLADSFAHCLHLPWSDAIDGPAELVLLARARLATVYGAAVDGWDVRAHLPQYGQAGLVCAFDSALLDALRALCARHRVRLTGMQAHFVEVVNRWRARLGEQALIVCIEGERCLLASRRSGAWHSIRAADAGEDLSCLIARELLLQELAPDCPLYIHAEHQWRQQLDGLANVALIELAPAVAKMHQAEAP